MRPDALQVDGGARFRCRLVAFGVLVAAIVVSAPRLRGDPAPPVMVVDIIPESLSGETDTNSEPSLAVYSTDPSKVVASTWIPEPMGAPLRTRIFISVDGRTKSSWRWRGKAHK